MTFSLIGHCPRTGRFGAVVTSSSPAVAARCAWAQAGVGVACTQNVTDPGLGPRLLTGLASGLSATDALAGVVADAPHIEHRQLSVLGADGVAATYSGERTLGRHLTATATHCAAAGNLLAGDDVPQAMVDAFLADPDADIGDRLVAGLRAGDDAGGEEGPVHSCGLVVVDQVAWPVTDLRVDWTDADPIAELTEIWQLWKPQAEDYVRRALDPASAPTYGVPGDE